MTDRARVHDMDERLVPLRAKLDQLIETADNEGVRVTKETTEALMGALSEINRMKEDAAEIGNKRLIEDVEKERRRAREGLGLEPRARYKRWRRKAS